LDGKQVASPHPYEHAVVSRDSVARAVYSALFDRLILRINEQFKTGRRFRRAPSSMLGVVTHATDSDDASASQSIGVLDLFGFENVELNSLEQLLINYANEQVQVSCRLERISEESFFIRRCCSRNCSMSRCAA
jgi:myosin heavy subunit